MKTIRFLAVVMVLGFFFVSCSGGSDNGGTTGGSGETQSTAATQNNTANDNEQTDEASDQQTQTSNQASTTAAAPPANPTTDSQIWLDAYSFNCTSNWTNRDGPLGLAPYSGSGSCTKAFSGPPGNYKLVLSAGLEFDGKSPYRVSINGQTIKQGEYPLSSPLGCACPLDQWRSVCPDRSSNINLGTHTLNTGDVIEFWGDDVYPCGEHGAYAKWYGIKAIKK